MSLRVTVSSQVKPYKGPGRSESESEQGVELEAVDAKRGDLPMVRLKVR